MTLATTPAAHFAFEAYRQSCAECAALEAQGAGQEECIAAARRALDALDRYRRAVGIRPAFGPS